MINYHEAIKLEETIHWLYIIHKDSYSTFIIIIIS